MTALKFSWRSLSAAFVLALEVACLLAVPGAKAAERQRGGDYIVAVVNQELVTAGEVNQRVERAKQEAARTGAKLPPDAELRKGIEALLAVLQVEGDAALAVHGLHQIFVDIVPVLVIVFKEVLKIALLVDHQAVDAVGAQKLRRRPDARRVHIKM